MNTETQTIKQPNKRARRGVQGGYQPQPGPKPQLPATGSGVRKPSTAVAVHKPEPPKTLLQMIAEAARDPAVDVQKMKELLAIKREEDALVAERHFNEALADAQKDMPRVTRDAKSDKHRYVRLETVTKVLDPIIALHRFSLSFGMSDSPIEQHYRVTATLSHVAGHKREYFIDLPADTKGAKGGENKTPVQGIGSTISYARRYLTLMIFNVAVQNEDDDGRGGKSEPITEDQLNELNVAMTTAKADLTKFCEHFGIDALPDLPASRFAGAMKMLNQKLAEQHKSAGES